MIFTRRAFTGFAASTLALPFVRPAGAAEETVRIGHVCELSGAGATAGGNWRKGVEMGVAEVNAAGGILGRRIEMTTLDSQSNPGVSRAMVQKALDADPYVMLGPIYSGSIKVNMALTRAAKIAQIMGGDAADLTASGNPYVFRTNLGQATSMPKLAAWVKSGLKAKRVAVLWVNNDFGKGGRDNFTRELKSRGIEVAADVPTEQGQVDFAADVVKIGRANADAAFIYTNEDESARFLIEARKQNLKLPLFGETTLIGQKVIDLAGPAADGIRGHVGLTADAPVAALQDYKNRYQAKYGEAPDHNGIKGYVAVAMVKGVTEKMGRFDRAAFAETLHGLTITTAMEPRILMDTTWDKNGDMDRVSFMVEVAGGKQRVVETLPPLRAAG
ncbi:MAG TPA: ABC transporter substrate-binding protein [Acetobacteraceae bacterium]